jgi:hypothetical protein
VCLSQNGYAIGLRGNNEIAVKAVGFILKKVMSFLYLKMSSKGLQKMASKLVQYIYIYIFNDNYNYDKITYYFKN